MEDQKVQLEEELAEVVKALFRMGQTHDEIHGYVDLVLDEMENQSLVHLVMYNDKDGVPRAWAYGEDLSAVREEAKRQVAIYVEERRMLGWRISPDEFTVQEKVQEENYPRL